MECSLNNKYWVLRHGRSIPNELDLIVSHESNGTLLKYGLATEGFKQARAAAQLFLKEFKESGLKRACIYSSPFSRTMQTAECVVEGLKNEVPDVEIRVSDVFNMSQCFSVDQVLHELRERYFGPVHELKSRLDYSHDDVLDPFAGPEGGESVMEVSGRALKAINQVEAELKGYGVLFVGHGDVLQILRAIFEFRSSKTMQSSEYPAFLSHHKRFELHNCELRRLPQKIRE